MRPNLVLSASICQILIAATVFSFWPVLSHDFVGFDDPEYVKNNPHVLAGLTPEGWTYAWCSSDCSNWHPLTWLSLEADGSLSAQNAGGYHATNLLLHVLNALLLFIALQQMTSAVGRSAVVALFFAVHPLHAESVAWISERKDVLSTFFLLFTLLAYIRYSRRPSLGRYCLVSLGLCLGLLSKPMLVTLPILLLLLDVWPLERVRSATEVSDVRRIPQHSLRWLLVEKLPLFMFAVLDGIITIVVQRDATNALSRLTLDLRVANAINAYCWYLYKTFVPLDLMAFYPHPERTLAWWTVAIQAALLVTVTLLVIRRRHSAPHLLVGWFWFVIALLPVIGLLQVGGQAYADRYAYIPHIGLFLAIVWEAASWSQRTKTSLVAAKLVAVVSILACVGLTRTQVNHWKDSESLWIHAIQIDPDNFFAHEHLVDACIASGSYERAMIHCQRVVQINRSWNLPSTYCNWARCLLALNRPSEAEDKLRTALRVDQNHEPSLYELSELLRKQGRQDEAATIAARHSALSVWRAKMQPDSADAQLALGLSFVRQGDAKRAQLHFEKAVKLAPNSVEAVANLGMIQLQLNRIDLAKMSFYRVLKLNPDLAAIHFCLAQILEGERDFPGARQHFAEALRLNPSDADARKGVERLSK